jgi:hypothetical protein
LDFPTAASIILPQNLLKRNQFIDLQFIDPPAAFNAARACLQTETG